MSRDCIAQRVHCVTVGAQCRLRSVALNLSLEDLIDKARPSVIGTVGFG
jgi:hypothetical protein